MHITLTDSEDLHFRLSADEVKDWQCCHFSHEFANNFEDIEHTFQFKLNSKLYG